MGFDQTPFCGKCGYEMTGLPQRGTCPECGNPYNVMAGSGLSGDARGERKPSKFVKHLRTISIGCAACCILICTGLASLVAASKERVVYSGLIMAGVCILGAVTSYVYEKNPD